MCSPSPSMTNGSYNFNWARFERYPMDDGTIQVMFNEYFVNHAIWAAFYGADDFLAFRNLSIPLDTTIINLGLGGDLASHGFENGAPCSVSVYADPQELPPFIRFRNDPITPLEIDAQLWISLHC